MSALYRCQGTGSNGPNLGGLIDKRQNTKEKAPASWLARGLSLCCKNTKTSGGMPEAFMIAASAIATNELPA